MVYKTLVFTGKRPRLPRAISVQRQWRAAAAVLIPFWCFRARRRRAGLGDTLRDAAAAVRYEPGQIYSLGQHRQDRVYGQFNCNYE